MRPPTSVPGSALQNQSVLVLHNPFDHFALFDFQSLCQWRGANQIPLAVLTVPLNDLDHGLIAHWLCSPRRKDSTRQGIIAIQLVNECSDFFTRSDRTYRTHRLHFLLFLGGSGCLGRSVRNVVDEMGFEPTT